MATRKKAAGKDSSLEKEVALAAGKTKQAKKEASEKPVKRPPRKVNMITALKNIAEKAFNDDVEEGGRILSIDGTLKAETDTKKLSDTVIELADSYRDRKILTGVISQIEETENKNPYASLMYNGVFKIIFPASEFLDLTREALSSSEQKRYHHEKLLLFKRLNSEVDFIVENQIDAEKRVAAGSHRSAMKQKRHMYWLTPDRNGSFIINEGSRVEARIVSSNQKSLTVEIFGVETQIRIEDISYDFIQDLLSSEYQVGKTVPVKIMSIDRTDPDNIHVEASIKDACSERPMNRFIEELDSGNVTRLIGEVEQTSVYGIFVRLSNGIQCLCHVPSDGRHPLKGDKVVVKIDRIEHESKHIYGYITHIL